VPVFVKGSERARESGRKGGLVSAEARRGRSGPYTGSVLALMDAAGMTDGSWFAWRAFLKAVFALRMSDDEVSVFRRHTERETPPTAPVSQAYMIVGRRGGKSSIAALCAVHAAISFDASLVRPGESVLIPLIASDRRQARLLLRYVHGLCHLPLVQPYVSRAIRETIEFRTSVDATVVTASVAAPRGPTIPLAVADEVAHWTGTTPDAADPDEEIVAAVLGGMSTSPGALLLVLSSPYGQQGVLYDAFERSFGKDDPDVLVWNADTLSMHPAGDDPAGDALRRAIDRMWQRDPVKAASEYGRDGRVVFRTSTAASFLTPDVVDRAIDEGVRERAAALEQRYVAFVDVSGARRDAWALAIAHKETDGTAVLDVLRQRQPPLDIAQTVDEWMTTLVKYDVRRVTGDRYAAEFCRQVFASAGVVYEASPLTRDEIYVEALSVLNTGRVRLLDAPTLRAQLVALQRKTRPGGRDAVDHPTGGHDDTANAALGAVCLALGVVAHTKKKHVAFV
jgi:hypothetical protein